MKLIQLRYLVVVAGSDLDITQDALTLLPCGAGGRGIALWRNDVEREFSEIRIPYKR